VGWIEWLPLRFIIGRAARSRGFLDPVDLTVRLRSIAQPSEVGEPVAPEPGRDSHILLLGGMRP
jgi:hypothetical protein